MARGRDRRSLEASKHRETIKGFFKAAECEYKNPKARNLIAWLERPGIITASFAVPIGLPFPKSKAPGSVPNSPCRVFGWFNARNSIESPMLAAKSEPIDGGAESNAYEQCILNENHQ